MQNSIMLPVIDNGMSLCRTRWACSLFDATIRGAFNGRRVGWIHISYPYPSGACNVAAHAFMESDFDEVLFCDLDIIFRPDDLRMLLSHDAPYVGGIVPKRVMGVELAVMPYEPLASDPFAPGVEPLIDADCGRGFVRIHRSVFETVKPHVPTYIDDQEVDGAGQLRHEYFVSKPGGHSEDFAFCETYRRLGGKPKVDQRICVRHEGSAVYPIKGTS